MKTLCKSLILMLITSAMVYGQRHRILNRVISPTKNQTLHLNIDNLHVAIEESTDGKIYLNYSLEFDGYSKKAIKEQIERISVDIQESDKRIFLDATSEDLIAFESIKLKGDYGISMVSDNFGTSKDSIPYKTEDQLIEDIKKNNRLDWSGSPLKYINERFKKVDKDGKLSNIRKGNVDIMRSQFIIKIPPFVKVKITGKKSKFYFRTDLRNAFNIDLESGSIRAKTLSNTENRIWIENGVLEAENLFGAQCFFKNLSPLKIGKIENCRIQTEFSKLEIGTVGKKNIIKDFNSEFRIYNWSRDFSKFNMITEYSKLNIFLPKLTDYYLETSGHNTLHHWESLTTEIPPSRENKSSKMMVLGDEASARGKVYLEATHGIIRFGEDLIVK